MWLQAVAIALPRVQVHYAVPTSSIGYLSSAMFLGMMLGAVSRPFVSLSLQPHTDRPLIAVMGDMSVRSPSLAEPSIEFPAVSDLLGRIRVFQMTLFFAAAFGFLDLYTDTFPSLCFANFLLGTAVGVSASLKTMVRFTKFPAGINADRWNFRPRDTSPRQATSLNLPVDILLSRIRRGCSRSAVGYSRKLVPTFSPRPNGNAAMRCSGEEQWMEIYVSSPFSHCTST